MTQHLVKGRQTIRRAGSVTGLHGPVSTPIRYWTFDAKPNTTLDKLEQAYFMALGSVDRVEERTRSNAATGRFTAEGLKVAALEFVLSEAVPSLSTGRRTINKAKAEVAERKAKLKVAGPDKTDAAAAVRRSDIRTQLRAMKPEDQSKFFAQFGDDLPSEVATAIMEMSPEFSGVPKSRHDLITKRALEAQHGPEIAEITEIEEAIAVAEGAVEAARTEVRLECGVQEEAKFNELVAPIEQRDTAVWLRRRKNSSGAEEISVVDLARRVERIATPEEIERGTFYESYEQYQRGKTA